MCCVEPRGASLALPPPPYLKGAEGEGAVVERETLQHRLLPRLLAPVVAGPLGRRDKHTILAVLVLAHGEKIDAALGGGVPRVEGIATRSAEHLDVLEISV